MGVSNPRPSGSSFAPPDIDRLDFEFRMGLKPGDLVSVLPYPSSWKRSKPALVVWVDEAQREKCRAEAAQHTREPMPLWCNMIAANILIEGEVCYGRLDELNPPPACWFEKRRRAHE